MVDAVINRHLHNWIFLLDEQSCRLCGFRGRVGAFRLPVDLEQKSTALRPLALRWHLFDFLLRTVLSRHFHLARRHSLLLFGMVLQGYPLRTSTASPVRAAPLHLPHIEQLHLTQETSLLTQETELAGTIPRAPAKAEPSAPRRR